MATTKKTTKETKVAKEVKAKPKAKVIADEFAIFETGGKQYKVSPGETVSVEKIKGAFTVGDKIEFDKVLLVDNGTDTSIGTPYISGAKIEAKLKEIGREAKVTVVKYKAKSRYYKKRGHRQPFFKVEIVSIK